MTKLRTLALLLPLFLLAACGSDAGATSNIAGTANSLTKILSGITDTKSAEAAKTQLGTLTDTLSTALGNLKSAGESAGGEAKNVLGGIATKALGALSPQITQSLRGLKDQVAGLLGNAEITKVIGPLLGKLKGVLPQ